MVINRQEKQIKNKHIYNLNIKEEEKFKNENN